MNLQEGLLEDGFVNEDLFEDPLISRLAHYIRIGVASEQLERDLGAVKGVEDANRLLALGNRRALIANGGGGGGGGGGSGSGGSGSGGGNGSGFALPSDVANSDLVRLGVSPEQAALWAEDWDELEVGSGLEDDEDDDGGESYEYYAEMVSRGVPHAAVAARLERDGEDPETIELFALLCTFFYLQTEKKKKKKKETKHICTASLSHHLRSFVCFLHESRRLPNAFRTAEKCKGRRGRRDRGEERSRVKSQGKRRVMTHFIKL
jgi:hypothetical protein